jgi:hypothetical protein
VHKPPDSALALWGVALSVVLAVIYCLQLRAMLGQADLMQKQLNLMDKQMRISLRPWDGIEDSPEGLTTSTLHFDDKGNAFVDFQFRLRNFGAHPAQGVHAEAELWPLNGLDDTVIAKEQEVCRRFSPSGYGNDLFPGNQRFIKYGRAPFTGPDFERTQGQETNIFLFGCIYYTDQFGTVTYHTGYTWRYIEKTNPQEAVTINPRLHSRSMDYEGVFALYHSSID